MIVLSLARWQHCRSCSGSGASESIAGEFTLGDVCDADRHTLRITICVSTARHPYEGFWAIPPVLDGSDDPVRLLGAIVLEVVVHALNEDAYGVSAACSLSCPDFVCSGALGESHARYDCCVLDAEIAGISKSLGTFGGYELVVGWKLLLFKTS